MAVVVKKLSDIGKSVIEAFEDDKENNIMRIYESLLINTPKDTNTLVSNWRLSPGSIANKTYFIENTGEKRIPKSVKDARFDYVRNWKTFSLYNNSPYVGIVNNGLNGNAKNQNFIQRSVEQAVGSFEDDN